MDHAQKSALLGRYVDAGLVQVADPGTYDVYFVPNQLIVADHLAPAVAPTLERYGGRRGWGTIGFKPARGRGRGTTSWGGALLPPVYELRPLPQDEFVGLVRELTGRHGEGIALNYVVTGLQRRSGWPDGDPEPAPRALPPMPQPPPVDGAGITVAVIDTGWPSRLPRHLNWFDKGSDHSTAPGEVDESGAPVRHIDLLDADRDGFLDAGAGHGLFVAGIMRQLAPSARLVFLKALNSDGVGTELGVAQAIRWAVARGVDVINLSLGFYTLDDAAPLAVAAAVADARAHGIAVVAAAGNDNLEDRTYPAALPGVIGVGALNTARTAKAGFSNYGDWVDVYAPGQHVQSTFVRGAEDPTATMDASADVNTALWSGTSFACAEVSGYLAAALSGATPAHGSATLPERAEALISSLEPTAGTRHLIPAPAFDFATAAINPAPEPRDLGKPISSENVPRYLNTWFVRALNGDVVRPPVDLAAGRSYVLRLSIDARDERSIVYEPKVFPDRLLPEGGNWLEVAATSADFYTPSRLYPLFLPPSGPAWVCACPRNTDHTCSASERSTTLDIDVVAPVQQGSTSLRVTVYYTKNVVQSQLVHAEIAASEVAGAGTSAEVDYTLTTSFRDLDRLPDRHLSMVTNDNGGASHTLVFNGDEDEVLRVQATEAQMDDAISAARKALYDAHIEENGQKRNRYDKHNAKSRDAFKDDLRNLARVGRLLWDAVFAGQRDRGRDLQQSTLREPSVIQVARAGGSTYVFPWALLYELPLEQGAPERWVFCEFVEEHHVDVTADVLPDRCPHEATHGLNTLCPYGLWGVHHVVEEPPSVTTLALDVPVAVLPPAAVVVTSDHLDVGITTTHLENLRVAGFNVRQAGSRPEVEQWLDENGLELLYFYCHGLDDPLPGANAQPYLGIGGEERLLPGDLGAWYEARWGKDHWARTAPLVVINGCHTVAISPGSLVNFVDAFAGVHAAGVIGTEVTLNQSVASEAALVLLQTLRRPGENVGSALRATRLHLIRKGNVMGLAYTAYCSAALHFSGPP